MIKAAESDDEDLEVVAKLREAKNVHQFSAKVSDLEPGIPKSLKIRGKNPLTLLHSVLSIDLHSSTDEDCLEHAHNIRILLIALSERIDNILESGVQLRSAIQDLQNLVAEKRTSAGDR